MVNKYIYIIYRIGLKKYILSFLGVILFLALFLYANGEISPKSVYVSGYTKSDGVKVDSYYRRKSGSVSHDAPFEFIMVISGLGVLGSLISSILLIKKYKESQAVDFFKKEIHWSCNLPSFYLNKVYVPSLSTKPNKDWLCDRCNSIIYKGTVYYYFNFNSRSKKNHICEDCKNKLEKDLIRYQTEKADFEKKLKIAQDERTRQIAYEYKIKFGEELPHPHWYINS